MPRRREFGISDYLLALVIVILVGLAIVRKWQRDRTAKRAEIRKLLRLAEEEAARVEAEAVVEYFYVPAVTPPQCAVCFSPTTTRCSRCKAVRYCSGKCQIIHWRQGHKRDCQPPDIDDSNTFVPSISIQKSEVNLSSLSEPQETESYDSNLEEPRNSTPIIKQLDEHAEPRTSSPTIEKLDGNVTEKHNVTALKGPQASDLKISSGTIGERPSADDTIPRVLESSVQSSTRSPVHIASLKDIPTAGVPTSVSTVSDISVNSSEHSPSTLRSPSVGIDISKNKIPLSDVSSSSAGNNASSLKVSTTELPASKNDRNHLLVSGISSGSPSGSSRFEHGLRSHSSHTDDLPSSKGEPYLPSAGNNSSISKSSENGQRTSRTVGYSSNSNSHEVDACYPLNQSSSTSLHVVDASSSRNCTPSNNGQEVDGSVPLSRPSNTTKRYIPTTRSSGENNSISGASLLKSSSQKHSVSVVSSSKSSLLSKDGSPSSMCSDSQDHLLNDLNGRMAASNIDSTRTSDPNGASRRSVRTVFQHSSSLKEKTSARSISRQKSGNYDAISSNAFQSVVSSLPTGNTLKASVKRVAQQLKPSKVSRQISTRTSNEGPGKSTKMLFPYESFVKLFNWEKLDLHPCGLINCGNSCYANAVLQCLMFTRPIAAYLLQGSHSKNCQKRDWCFMCELENLVAKVREGKNPISPIRILSKIQNIGNHLGYGKEEDAHEFLRFAIDTMQSTCLAEASGERAVDHRTQETTLIQQIFGGYLQSKIKCLKCQHISERYEKMMDLTVEIEGNIESLQDALGQFTASEILDGSNKYKCDRCKCYVKARKQLTVHEAPNILTIALKRFQSGKFGKLNKRVIFPEVLNMKPYMSGMGDKPPSYKLYAVVVHLDMMNASFSGHYVCYVKNSQGAWYKIDDSKVKQVELDRVLAQGAYMLLYSRSSPRPPAVAKNWMAHSLATVNVIPNTKAAKQPVLNSGPRGIGVLDGRYSSMASRAFNFEDYGFDCNGNPIIGSGNIVYRDYPDMASSDSGSLFSYSDETSCSTESNRDSTSTDDYVETIFGDSGQPTSSGLGEDPYTMSSSNCYMKSSPSSLQTAYYFENDAYILDSGFSNQHLFDDVYHGTRKIDPELTPRPNPLSQDTDGRRDLLRKTASSYFFPPFPSSHVETGYFDPDLCSRRSDQLDYRTSNINNHSESLQFQNSVGVPDTADTGAYSSSGDFSIPAKSQYENEKYPAGFLQEADRLNFDVTSRSFNAASSNFDYCFVRDTRTSDSTMPESFGPNR